MTFQSLIVQSRPCVSSDTKEPPVGSSRRLVTGATWPLSVHRQLPVVRSQMHMWPLSWPLRTHPSLDDMSSATQFMPGFHFLNSVPDCRSYTTMKLIPGSGSDSSISYARKIKDELLISWRSRYGCSAMNFGALSDRQCHSITVVPDDFQDHNVHN